MTGSEMNHAQQQMAEKAAAMKAASAPAALIFAENMQPAAAAQYLGLSASLLAKMRMKDDPRTGPPFARIGKAIIYRRTDLDTWLASRVEEAA